MPIPHAAECHSTQREKMEKVSGSAKNFESRSDKAERLCRGGYADGGAVQSNDQASFERMNAKAAQQRAPQPAPPSPDYGTAKSMLGGMKRGGRI